jgi:uncharacterized protein YciI
MAHYLLRYTVADDYLERRGQFRGPHLALAQEAVARGELLLAGAVDDLSQGSLLLFGGNSPAAAERFAEQDPYVLNGVVTAWRVDRWITVVGEQAAEPILP